nr:uncharacterized protein LOC127303599 [Lolium perenne]
MGPSPASLRASPVRPSAATAGMTEGSGPASPARRRLPRSRPDASRAGGQLRPAHAAAVAASAAPARPRLARPATSAASRQATPGHGSPSHAGGQLRPAHAAPVAATAASPGHGSPRPGDNRAPLARPWPSCSCCPAGPARPCPRVADAAGGVPARACPTRPESRRARTAPTGSTLADRFSRLALGNLGPAQRPPLGDRRSPLPVSRFVAKRGGSLSGFSVRGKVP